MTITPAELARLFAFPELLALAELLLVASTELAMLLDTLI
jgi:hypothetical protein